VERDSGARGNPRSGKCPAEYLYPSDNPFSKEDDMESLVKTKNVQRAEAILRCIIGGILIVFAFVIQGILRWVVGLIGVLFILTAVFGY